LKTNVLRKPKRKEIRIKDLKKLIENNLNGKKILISKLVWKKEQHNCHCKMDAILIIESFTLFKKESNQSYKNNPMLQKH